MAGFCVGTLCGDGVGWRCRLGAEAAQADKGWGRRRARRRAIIVSKRAAKSDTKVSFGEIFSEEVRGRELGIDLA